MFSYTLKLQENIIDTEFEFLLLWGTIPSLYCFALYGKYIVQVKNMCKLV